VNTRMLIVSMQKAGGAEPKAVIAAL